MSKLYSLTVTKRDPSSSQRPVAAATCVQLHTLTPQTLLYKKQDPI